jgi:hypothetical protein
MVSGQTILVTGFAVAWTAIITYFIVPLLFPQLVGTPALWVFSGGCMLFFLAFAYILTYRVKRKGREKS